MDDDNSQHLADTHENHSESVAGGLNDLSDSAMETANNEQANTVDAAVEMEQQVENENVPPPDEDAVEEDFSFAYMYNYLHDYDSNLTNNGRRLISEVIEINVLLNNLSGSVPRIADLVDIVESSSRSSSGSSAVDVPPPDLGNNPAEPVRQALGQVVRRINAGEMGISDTVLARLRRMVFRLDGRIQRRYLQSSERYRLSNSQSSGESREDAVSDDETTPPPNAVRFDTNLPAEHSYLGANMSRVSGVNYLEAGSQHNLLLFVHQHVLFPGEILPFMISKSVFNDVAESSTDGVIFGVCFPLMPVNVNNPNSDIYGVTCHIYEKGFDATGNMLIKSRALQRFIYHRDESSVSLQYIAAHPQFKCYGTVRILPEIFLPDPLKSINMGSLNRFREDPSMHNVLRRYQAASTPWPLFVYDYYNIDAIVEKARAKLAPHKIEAMPSDPVQLSFWLVRNLHLAEDLAREIFTTDSVNIRMKLIDGSFKEDAVFVCRYCGNRIADCRDLFAMSKYGVQTQYCNSAGYIHETNTVYRVAQNAISFSGTPSTEFSWFPGYEWHIIICQVCTRHIGWQFKAVEANLLPKSFYGISSSSVRISTRPEIDAEADINNVYRGIVRMARRRFD